MPVEVRKWIRRADLRAQPDALFIFGDNETRRGYGGQAAEMRGEPNAAGVATLRAPGRFWNETDTERQCAVIDADLRPAKEALAAGRIVVFPADGIGTGLAQLPRRAPSTWAHLQAQLAATGVPVCAG